MRNTNLAMRSRCLEELKKIAPDHVTLARRYGFQTNQTRLWWYEENIPSAPSLAKLHTLGVDIYYIITGERFTDEIAHICDTCTHYCDVMDDRCEKYDYDCRRCNHPSVTICRNCHDYSLWRWRGFPTIK